MKMFLMLAVSLASFQALALEVGDLAPCVVLTQVQTDGSEKEACIRDRSEGQTHTLIEFFSINCSVCRENLPRLTALGLELGERATTRLVSIDRNESAVRQFISINRQNLLFDVALDNERDAKRAYSVVSTPTLYVLDKDERVVYKHEGLLTSEDRAEITEIVNSN